jgi:hypothetical protein
MPIHTTPFILTVGLTDPLNLLLKGQLAINKQYIILNGMN